MSLIPTIDSKGCFSAASPFDTVVQNNKIYTVHAVRTLKEMELNGEDPFKTIYQPNGLTQTQYDTDVANQVHIVTLIGSGGEIIDVPNIYLTSLPTLNGVLYSSKVLAVPLGILPDNFDLSNLISNIHDLVNDMVGVNTTIKTIQTSADTKVSYADDATVTALRESIINSNAVKSWHVRYLEEQTLNAKLIEQLQKYECYIKHNCCGKSCFDAPPLDENVMPCEIIGRYGEGRPEDLYLKKMKDECQTLKGTPAPPPDDFDLTGEYYLYAGSEGCPELGDDPVSFYLQNMMG